MPSASRRPRTSSGSSVPATAEEPTRLRPKRALLIGPVDQPHGDRRWRDRRGERAQDLQRGHQAQRAVQPAARRHRIDVRADDDEAFSAAVSGQLGPEVPGRVAIDADPLDLGELAQQPLAGGRPVRRPRQPFGARVRRPAHDGELVQIGQHPVGVDRQGHAVAPTAAPARATKRPWPGAVTISPRS